MFRPGEGDQLAIWVCVVVESGGGWPCDRRRAGECTACRACSVLSIPVYVSPRSGGGRSLAVIGCLMLPGRHHSGASNEAAVHVLL